MPFSHLHSPPRLIHLNDISDIVTVTILYELIKVYNLSSQGAKAWRNDHPMIIRNTSFSSMVPSLLTPPVHELITDAGNLSCNIHCKVMENLTTWMTYDYHTFSGSLSFVMVASVPSKKCKIWPHWLYYILTQTGNVKCRSIVIGLLPAQSDSRLLQQLQWFHLQVSIGNQDYS